MPLAWRRNKSKHVILALLALVALSTAPRGATAATIILDTEFNFDLRGPFATVDVTENAGNLDFVMSIDLGLLGPSADLHELYFNLVSAVTGLSVINTNAPTTAYVLNTNPSVAGGAASSFEWEVNFGDGGTPAGNGNLMTAIFTLAADQNLSIADLMETSPGQGGAIDILMAAHVQGTTLTAASSEYIGNVAPEPSAGLLVLTGLIMLARGARSDRIRL